MPLIERQARCARVDQRLEKEGRIDPWLDEEKLYPGQDWDLEIEKAVEATNAVVVCLSNNSVSKEGYLQRELRFVLRIADFKPEGAVFVIPVRLDECPMPRRLSMWQYVDYFPGNRKDWAYKRLLGSLKVCANKLGLPTVNPDEEQARRAAKEKAGKEKEVHEKKKADEHAHINAEQKAKKEREGRERREAKGKEKEEHEIKVVTEQVSQEPEAQPAAVPVGQTSSSISREAEKKLSCLMHIDFL